MATKSRKTASTNPPGRGATTPADLAEPVSVKIEAPTPTMTIGGLDQVAKGVKTIADNVQGLRSELPDMMAKSMEAEASREENIQRFFGGFGNLTQVSDSIDGIKDGVKVSLQPAASEPSADQTFWSLIRNRTDAIGFNRYKAFMDDVLCCRKEIPSKPGLTSKEQRYHGALPFPGVEAYAVLKFATEAFLMQECGLFDGEGDLNENFFDKFRRSFDRDGEARRLRRNLSAREVLTEFRDSYLQELRNEAGPLVLPYFKLILEKLSDLPLKGPNEVPANCYGILKSKVTNPCLLELIWSYWHEEAMVVQSLNAISLRFQNRRLRSGPDPLTRLDIDPLRPMSNLFWGYLQDEQHRLSLVRRAYEYDHQYGISVNGKAVPTLQSVDSRSKFLEAFHNLLHLTAFFYKQDDDTTIIADGFPILNALREVHLLLAEGAHNQFGDLPSAAREEMLIQLWLLSRPEMREFLGGRIMVPYAEPWMDRVDTMKSLQGWTNTSATHFRDLGVFAEQVLLSVRYGNWSQENDRARAANWARYWRSEIQRYIHAYRVVTGVDIIASERVDTTPPSVHLRNRLAEQDRRR